MKDATEIVVVMDKSGSMHPRSGDAIGGFNGFLEEQKNLPGEANFTLVLFDTEYFIPIAGKPIHEVEPLTRQTYVTNGGTALLDALARAIVETGKRLAFTPEEERPDKVICVVITDGEENSSREHSLVQVREMVKHQEEKYNWKFLYLGIEIDAFQGGMNLGISGQASLGTKGRGATMEVYACASNAVSEYRTTGSLDEENWKFQKKDTEN